MTERRGRFIKYDKQAVLQDIVDGKLSAKAIAQKHGITRDMVYSLKHAAKKRNIIKDPVQKLDDLFPVEPRKKASGSVAHEIYLLAQDYAEGRMTGSSFHNEVCRLLGEPLRPF